LVNFPFCGSLNFLKNVIIGRKLLFLGTNRNLAYGLFLITFPNENSSSK